MADFSVYGGLFLIAFAAATLLPLQSEAALLGLALSQQYSFGWLIAAASLGNIAGSTVNWQCGRSLERLKTRRWFPLKPATLERAEAWYRRYGRWSLFLSWAPVIGDPLTMVAGALREPLPSFLLIVALAKTARYLVFASVAFA